MAVITINSNLASMQATRSLAKAASRVSATSERLATGLRITHASDDSAGLSIASGLEVASRVYSQGIANLNDGISMYNIADSALQSTKSSLMRMRELAAQAANGSMSAKQRRALDAEFQAQADEYNRIIDTTSFNGVQIFGAANSGISFSAGGSALDLSFGVGERTGDGTFSLRQTLSLAAGGTTSDVRTGDINGDGNTDIAYNDSVNHVVEVFRGNGDGSFAAGLSYSAGPTSASLMLADFNGDGFIDAATSNTNAIHVLLNNGNGTFKAPTSYLTNDTAGSIEIGDFNNDGSTDLLSLSWGGTRTELLVNNGDGSFKSVASPIDNFWGASNYGAVGDVNNDGNVDAVLVGGGPAYYVALGNGDASFRLLSLPGTAIPEWTDIQLADMNNDGNADILTPLTGGNGFLLCLGNGNGSFKAGVSMATGTTPYEATAADVNGDGNLDVITGDIASNTLSIHLGNGDGTFKARTSVSAQYPQSFALGDFNNDGGVDIVTDTNSQLGRVFTGNMTTSTVTLSMRKLSILGLSDMSVATRYDALKAQQQIDGYLGFVSKLGGALGASQSRLTHAVEGLQSARIETNEAGSRILDADVAFETAGLTSARILQEAASAVLSQANIQPSLALTLLRG